MKVFAVRHKPSGLFIPRLETGKRRGGSYLEPSTEREPRIFHSALAARAFIGAWLQGKFENHVDYEGEPSLLVKKQPHRKKHEMEIVTFFCVEARS